MPYGGGMPQGYPPGPAPGYEGGYVPQGPMGYEGGYMPDGEGCDDGSCRGMNHPGAPLAGARGFASVLAYGVAPYLAPVTEGGYCQMRYYDFYAEAMWLGRSNAGSMPIIATNGVGGPVALGGQKLEVSPGAGLHLNLAYQVAAGRTLEFNYYGLFANTERASVSNANNDLQTSISGYGAYPLGLGESNAQRVSYEFRGQLDNYEFNHRWRWVGPDCRWQGSYLFGVRYLGIGDKFLTRTFTPGADPFIYQEFENRTRTFTGLTGGQIGGDLWLNLYPGIRAGVETKAGIFGAKGSVHNELISTTVDNGLVNSSSVFQEALKTGKCAFVGDTSFLLTYRVAEQFTLRGGYNLLYVTHVNKAVSNYNPTAPNTLAGVPARGVIRVPNKGMEDDFFHGANFGIEYMW